MIDPMYFGQQAKIFYVSLFKNSKHKYLFFNIARQKYNAQWNICWNRLKPRKANRTGFNQINEQQYLDNLRFLQVVLQEFKDITLVFYSGNSYSTKYPSVEELTVKIDQ